MTLDMQRVDMYIISNQKYFPSNKLMYLKDRLLNMDEYRWNMISTIELKDPTTLLIVSIVAGQLGIDRFMLGETGMGILKLLTLGLCGILTIIDWFTISEKVKELNFHRLMTFA